MIDLQYWIDLEECRCDSEHPIGGCLKCDLIEAQKELKIYREALGDDLILRLINNRKTGDQNELREMQQRT